MRYETTAAIINAVNYIIECSQNQLQQNNFLRKNMNVYASQKLGSLINEMGQLIYQEAECSNGAQGHEINLLNELDEVKMMQKDNMIPGEVKIQILPESQNKYLASDSHSFHSQSIRSLNHSIYSFKTNLSKQRPRNVTISNQRDLLAKKDLKQHPNELQRVKTSSSKIINSSQLVSLVTESASKTRKSAFEQQSAQMLQQRILEEQLQQFREEKITLEEQMKKKAIKEKTMNQMLAKDEVVLSFYYDGQLIKMNQRDFESMKQKKFNQSVVESNLILKNNDDKFWKSKRNNRKIKTQSSISQFTENMMQSKPQSTKNKDKQIQKKKTSLKMIQELKKNAVQITKKKAITNDEDKKKKTSNRNSTTARFNQKNHQFIPLTSNQQNKHQNLSPQEQLQEREHHLEFLMKGLEKFHQQEKNFMPEWWKQVEKGCKLSVYLAERKPQKQNDKNQEKQKQRFNKKINRTLESRSYSQPSEIVSSMHDLQENKVVDQENQGKYMKANTGKQLKSIQNFKNPKRSNIELLSEWKKRKSLQNIQIKVSAPANKEVKSTTNSKAIVFSRSKSQQESQSQPQKNNENLRASNSFAKNQLNVNLQNKGSKNQNKGGQNQGNINQENYQNFKVLQAKNILNLNKKQFQTLRKYLKTKNDIIWKNEKLQTDKSVQYFLNSQIHEENKKAETSNQLQKEDKSQANVQKQSLNTSKDEKQSNNLKSLNYLNKYVNIQSKNRAFSVLEKTSLASPYKKSGSININNEKLKNTLLRQAQPDEISRSSILYILPEWQKAQIKESKEKVTGQKEIDRKKQINKSETNIIPQNSAKNSENKSLIKTNQKHGSFLQSPSILKYSRSTNVRNPSSIITPSTTFNMPSKSNLLKTN